MKKVDVDVVTMRVLFYSATRLLLPLVVSIFLFLIPDSYNVSTRKSAVVGWPDEHPDEKNMPLLEVEDTARVQHAGAS